MSRAASGRTPLLGAISGMLWFAVALAFDKGVQDFNFPVIPTNTVFATILSGLASVTTGVCIAFIFRRPLLSRSRRIFFGLPVLTLPSAITIFSFLVWLVWLGAGDRAGVAPVRRLEEILSFFLLYGLISLFTPLLYGLALANQYLLRLACDRAT